MKLPRHLHIVWPVASAWQAQDCTEAPGIIEAPQIGDRDRSGGGLADLETEGLVIQAERHRIRSVPRALARTPKRPDQGRLDFTGRDEPARTLDLNGLGAGRPPVEPVCLGD